jgi:hypothetical protein
MGFATNRADLLRGPLTYVAALRRKTVVRAPDMMAARISELPETADSTDLGRASMPAAR